MSSQLEILMMVLKNVFKENVRAASPSAELHKTLGKNGLGKFNEGLAILDLGADQLGEFIAPHAQRKCRPNLTPVDEFQSHVEDEMDRFEKLLRAGESLNGPGIQKMLAEAIEDRLAKVSKNGYN